MPRDRAGGLAVRLGARATRRSFLGVVGAAVGILATGRATGDAFRVPGAEPVGDGWYGFCGHYFTTGSCPSPFDLPRIDRDGFPVRPSDGRPVDNLGRLIDGAGRPVDEQGRPLADPFGLDLEVAPRTRICEDWVPERFGIDAVTQGDWYRCCGGQVRRLVDCCSTHRRRINGDAPLTGYCVEPRGVFCVMYHETGVPC